MQGKQRKIFIPQVITSCYTIGKEGESMKAQILKYASETYGTEAEYPFAPDDTAVLRQAVSRKWYGVIMNVSY